MSIHDGHRARKKEQFLRHGLDAFADHEVLELLLFYALPRKDTNAIAHQLLRRFGTLESVFSATPRELAQVEGVGKNAATLISLILPLQRHIRTSVRAKETPLVSTEAAGKYFCDIFFGEKQEKLYLACLDGKGRLITCVQISEGSVDFLQLNARRIAETVLSAGATGVILAHNHPSGVALPSKEDQSATALVARALAPLQVDLIDHIIVADEDFVSMRASGMI